MRLCACAHVYLTQRLCASACIGRGQSLHMHHVYLELVSESRYQVCECITSLGLLMYCLRLLVLAVPVGA